MPGPHLGGDLVGSAVIPLSIESDGEGLAVGVDAPCVVAVAPLPPQTIGFAFPEDNKDGRRDLLPVVPCRTPY